MTDNPTILQRYAGRRLEIADAAPAPSPQEEVEDLGPFGYLRGIRDRAIMLELRKRNGNIKAFGYAWLVEAEYDPSVGITLLIAGQRVRIVGRNLNSELRAGVRLFSGLIQHRVTFIQEADEQTLMRLKTSATIVESVEG